MFVSLNLRRRQSKSHITQKVSTDSNGKQEVLIDRTSFKRHLEVFFSVY